MTQLIKIKFIPEKFNKENFAPKPKSMWRSCTSSVFFWRQNPIACEEAVVSFETEKEDSIQVRSRNKRIFAIFIVTFFAKMASTHPFLSPSGTTRGDSLLHQLQVLYFKLFLFIYLFFMYFEWWKLLKFESVT